MSDSIEDKCTMIFQGVTRTLETGEVAITGRIEYPKGANHMADLLSKQYQGILVFPEDWDIIKSDIQNGDILAFEPNGHIRNIDVEIKNSQTEGENDTIYVLGADRLSVQKRRFDNVVKFPGSKYPKLRPL